MTRRHGVVIERRVVTRVRELKLAPSDADIVRDGTTTTTDILTLRSSRGGLLTTASSSDSRGDTATPRNCRAPSDEKENRDLDPLRMERIAVSGKPVSGGFLVWESVMHFCGSATLAETWTSTTQRPVVGAAQHAFPLLKSVDDARLKALHRAVFRRRDTRNMMDKVEMIADALGVPVVALVPVALVAVAVLAFFLDGLSHTVLKPFKSPPVIATLPLVGGMAEFLKGPIGLMAKAMPKYGEVFTGASPPRAIRRESSSVRSSLEDPTIRSERAARSRRRDRSTRHLLDASSPSPLPAVPVFHKRITFLIGPKVSEHFFKAKDTEMSQKEVYDSTSPTFGKGVVFDVDHQTRAEQFRFFADSLKSNRLRQYVGMMVKEAEDYFGKWGESGEWTSSTPSPNSSSSPRPDTSSDERSARPSSPR